MTLPAESAGPAEPAGTAGPTGPPGPAAPAGSASPAAPPGAGIVVDSVARSFGDVHAVRNVTMTARPGEVTALVGPNGSGKTTLLLMLASLLAPDRGTIRVNGIDPVADPGAARALIGWMPDALGSWPNLTVRETLVLTARLYRIPRPQARERAAELIRMVELVELADRPTRVLSRGQKQRLSLARSLVHDPRVLLLDEPASGLDPGARVRLRLHLRQLAAAGCTIIVSSHVLSELEEMADTAVYLDEGVTASAERIAAARASARPWRIVALDPAAAEPALIAAGVPAAAIQRDAATTVVAVEGGDAAAARLLSTLVASGLEVVSFAPAVGELEHTFLDLSSGPTGGDR